MKPLQSSLFRRRAAGALAIAVLVVAVETALAQAAAPAPSRASTAGLTAQQRAFAASLPSGLRNRVRWYTIGHRRVWGVALSLRMTHRGVIAHAASAGYCGNPGPGELSCYQNLGSGLCMSSYPNTQGSAVDQYGCNGSANQTWILGWGTGDQPYFEAYGAGPWNLCLNNWGGGFSDGNVQRLYSCNAFSYAMWYDFGASRWSGWYLAHLYNAPGSWSNMCLTTLGNTHAGSPIEEWTCNVGAANQSFDGDPTPNNTGFQGH